MESNIAGAETNATHPLIGQLRPIFAELHTCGKEALPSVILKLDYVIDEEKDALFHRSATKAASTTNTKVLPNWLNQQLRSLFRKPETQYAGVRVLRALLPVEYMELNEMTKLFSELLVRCVLDTGDYALGLEAAEVWGCLLNNGSNVAEGIVLNCLQFSVSLLLRGGHDVAFLERNPLHNAAFGTHSSGLFAGAGDNGDFPLATKLAGCVFLGQLVRTVPSATVSHLGSIFEGLRRAIIDNNELVRLSSADALCYTLRIAYRSTDTNFSRLWQDILLGDAINGISEGSQVILHGALLLFNSVMSSLSTTAPEQRVVGLSPNGAQLVREMWAYINDEFRSPVPLPLLIKEQVLGTLPFFASYDRAYFKETTALLLAQLAKRVFTSTEGLDDRDILFDAIGKLVTVMPELVTPFLDRMMSYIEMSLSRRPNRERSLAAVSCFATLSETDPNAVRPFLRHILGPLFAGSITQGFARDVAKICSAFPELRSTCLSKMLESTKVQLQAARLRSVAAANAPAGAQGGPSSGGEEARHFILENLNALGSLDFTGYSTLQFLCDAVVRYVSDPHEEVRRSAIDLCFKLVLSGCTQSSPCERTQTGVVVHKGREHMRLVNTVIKKLVNAAVADAESDIRLHTLGRFTEAYDDTLALQEIASSLFPALHDKHQNRVVAVRLLGRVSRHNPSSVYPMLRRVTVQCVADIKLFHIPKKQEQATALLSVLVESAPEMVKPYVSSLLHDCVARLQDPAQPMAVQTALLACVGKLARYAEGADVEVVAGIRPCVIGHILDSSNILKKQEAIRALGDIIRTTKDVDVYETHPELLHVLLSALHGGFKETWPVRLDVLKLMGIIGAVDPVKVKEITRKLRDTNASSSDTALVSSGFSANRGGEEAVAQSVVKNVLNVLRLTSLTDDQCICGVDVIANVLSLKEISGYLVRYYPDIITIVLEHTRQQTKIRERLLHLLTRIVYMLGQHIRPYLDTLMETVTAFLPSAERGVLIEILCLLGELRRSLNEEFRPCLSSLLPPIMDTVLSDPVRAGEPVFAFLIEMGSLLDHYLHNILPCVCDVACNQAYALPVRTAAVDAIRHFAKRLPRLAYHASRTIHCLCRILKETDLPAAVASLPGGSLSNLAGSSTSARGTAASTTAAGNTNPSANTTTNGKPGQGSRTTGHVGSPHGGSTDVPNGTPNPAAVVALETLVAVTLDAIRDVALNLGADAAKYAALMFPILDGYGKEGQEVKAVVSAAVRSGGRVLAPDARRSAQAAEEAAERYQPTYPPPRRATDDPFAPLRIALVARDRETEEDWNNWLKKLSVELLRSSPALSHGFAYPLAQVHEPFARHMLHSAFAVCFGEMDGPTREMVVDLLGSVLHSERVPSEVLQELLNLSEYMERAEMRFNPKEGAHSVYAGLLFDLKTLMDSSERCNLYSKALHYVEIQFYETTHEYERGVMRGRPRPLAPEKWQNLLELCEKSIYLCNLLGQRESAEGMLTYLQTNFSLLTGRPASELPQMMDAQLFEKLQWWSQSLKAYQHGLQVEPNKFSNVVGLMRSLDNLGDSGRLLEAWKTYYPRVNAKEASEMAQYGAHAAWLLRCWDDMDNITEHMTDDGYVGTTAVFYRAVLATYKRKFHEAVPIIQLCRKRLDSALSALVAESYDRAYGLFVGIQQLSELEEFAFVAENPQGLNHWQELWEERLGAMAYEGWPGTLANHTLVIPPSHELDMWLRFASLSRVYGRERTSSEILFELLGSRTISSALNQSELPLPAVALASFQHLYDIQERDRAIELLDDYLAKMDGADFARMTTESRESLAVCHSKLGNWLLAQRKKRVAAVNERGGGGGTLRVESTSGQRRGSVGHHPTTATTSVHNIARARVHLERATLLDGQNGAIWHAWARFNNNLVTKAASSLPSSSAGTGGAEGRRDTFVEHVVCALDGYLKSVCLSGELEDTLGFLSLWFSHASLPQVQNSETLWTEILQVSPKVWLKVIPQIIARLHSRNPVVSESVYKLLVTVARSHPQALLYNLNVTNASVTEQQVQQSMSPTTSEQVERRRAAQRILKQIASLHSNGSAMVNDAAMVCHELVRCAVLWTELWFDELERAWFQWGRDKNAHNVLLTLQPLVEQLKAPETMAESHFVAEFGDLLMSACDSVQQAATLNNNIYMEEAWNRFKTAVKRMDEQINNMSSLALQLVSPRLLQSGNNLSLVVPGHYQESGHYPRIASFESTLKVINSKQHPRRLYIHGTDGVVYKFLLKGHEDLRLDERVMQLLAFVNTLMEKHSAIQRQDSMIQFYSVTPLSDNAGLVGWVDHCDTLHQLVKEYRVHSKYLSIEINLMHSYGVDLDRLTTIQHVEPFEFALEQTEGTDLANSLWMRAPSAETWLDRRTTYVCSLATMSMVGHILGLGDRHPSNLMIHSFSGRIVHIDFGDCFDVAQNRSAFPEKVPFRLTRMLVKAMEMGGIEGLFRHGCINVMGMLREEGSSLLALLEAFVHDPLVSWWRDEPDDEESASSSAPSASATSVASSSAPGGYVKHTAYNALGESFQRRGASYKIGSLDPRSLRYRGAAAAHVTGTSLRTELASPSQPASADPGVATATTPATSMQSNNSQRQTSKAQKVVNRIREKLEGREYPQLLHRESGADEEGLPVEAQVSKLIEEATSNENLCRHFQGWCPFW